MPSDKENVKYRFIWRAWFWFGTGGSITTAGVWLTLQRLPWPVRAYATFCAIGLLQGLYNVVLRGRNPVTFLPPLHEN